MIFTMQCSSGINRERPLHYWCCVVTMEWVLQAVMVEHLQQKPTHPLCLWALYLKIGEVKNFQRNKLNKLTLFQPWVFSWGFLYLKTGMQKLNLSTFYEHWDCILIWNSDKPSKVYVHSQIKIFSNLKQMLCFKMFQNNQTSLNWKKKKQLLTWWLSRWWMR